MTSCNTKRHISFLLSVMCIPRFLHTRWPLYVPQVQVHTLRENPNPCGTSPKTILHLNHGFGASSISWSLVIQQLSQALNAVTVAHDAPGFGLTGRPGLWQAAQYSLGNNAGEACVCMVKHSCSGGGGGGDGDVFSQEQDLKLSACTGW